MEYVTLQFLSFQAYVTFSIVVAPLGIYDVFSIVVAPLGIYDGFSVVVASLGIYDVYLLGSGCSNCCFSSKVQQLRDCDCNASFSKRILISHNCLA